MAQRLDLIIIGGGQAGLAAAYYAKNKGLSYLILDANTKIGQSWRDRYDSLTLFTPRRYSSLPDLSMAGDSEGYPTKDEMADYLETYAGHFQLDISLNAEVKNIIKNQDGFIIQTSRAQYKAKTVIVATGPFQTPRLPDWHTKLTIPQFHSSEYKNSSQLAGQDILVVGGGNSGTQIAEEIAANHSVTVAVMGIMRFVPARILGKSLFWWLDKFGFLNAPTESWRAKFLQKRGDPIIGGKLKKLLTQGSAKIKPAATYGNGNTVTFSDKTSQQFSSVVWSTGYIFDYSWLNIPGALGASGQPLHKYGKSTDVENLYFMGLSWLSSRNSALVGGVGRDAKRLIDQIK